LFFNKIITFWTFMKLSIIVLHISEKCFKNVKCNIAICTLRCYFYFSCATIVLITCNINIIIMVSYNEQKYWHRWICRKRALFWSSSISFIKMIKRLEWWSVIYILNLCLYFICLRTGQKFQLDINFLSIRNLVK